MLLLLIRIISMPHIILSRFQIFTARFFMQMLFLRNSGRGLGAKAVPFIFSGGDLIWQFRVFREIPLPCIPAAYPTCRIGWRRRHILMRYAAAVFGPAMKSFRLPHFTAI